MGTLHAIAPRLAKLDREITKLDRDARHLIEVLGFKGEFPDRSHTVRPKQFQHFRRSEALSAYLTHARMPQTATQCAAALERGGVRSTAKDPYAATSHALSYGRGTGRFRKFGVGAYWTLG